MGGDPTSDDVAFLPYLNEGDCEGSCGGNLEFARNLFEKVGYRMTMDAVLAFLISSKAGQLVAEWMEFNQINLSLGDLFIKPLGHHPFRLFWAPELPSQSLQLQAAKQALQEIAQLQVGSLIVLALLHEMQLVVEDVAATKP